MGRLKDLLTSLEYECIRGTEDIEVDDVVYDSRKVTKDCLFICIKGANVDGHDFAGQVVANGAGALIVQNDVELPEDADVTVIRVKDTRYAMAFISAAYFGNPADELKIIGITGTKGKTTTTYLVKSILEHSGHKVGLIGTIEVIIPASNEPSDCLKPTVGWLRNIGDCREGQGYLTGDTHIHANNTTPESYLIQQYFRQMADAGCDAVVMEVSSQGLMLHRTQGFIFDYGIFTNIEPDHIGPNEHKDFEDYLACKGMLFKQCRVGIVNKDDKHWEQVTSGHTCELETFGIETEADMRAENLELSSAGGSLGVSFDVTGLMDFKAEIAMPGRFSVYNALTAIAICRHFEVGQEVIVKALFLAKVKGRIESVKVSDDFTLLIDYAHNAMALESLLSTLKEYKPHRLLNVFGCGGNRSKLRRYEMGEVSGRLADLTIITSDNPRFEKPQDIIDDIKIGISKTEGKYIEIADRKEAIAYAIDHGEPGDIIVLAGKGHEDYQEIEGVKYPMDERDLIQAVLSERKK